MPRGINPPQGKYQEEERRREGHEELKNEMSISRLTSRLTHEAPHDVWFEPRSIQGAIAADQLTRTHPMSGLHSKQSWV